MNIDCLLVLENNHLLNFALASLLSPESEIVAVRSKAKDYQELVEEIQYFNTQVVIIEGSAKLAEKDSIAHLLASHPMIKIIVVLRNSNFLHIFRKTEVALSKSDDLLKAIHSV